MRARIAIFATVLVTALTGCPSDQDTPPENESGTGNETSATEPGPTTTVSPTSTATTTTVGTEESGPIDTSAGSEDSTSGGEECLGKDGCWDCAPVSPEQVLNHCTNSDCEPFDNSTKRLPLIGRDGELPPIP